MSRTAICVVLILGGCQTIESENIRTSGIYASYAARSTGDGRTTLSATLYLEDPGTDFIELEGDDELLAWQGSTSRRMSEQEFLYVVGYETAFDLDDADTTFRIELRRSIDKSAPNSTVSLPAPFEFTSEPPATASRAAELSVSWTPGGSEDPMRWSATGDCIEGASGVIAIDTGTLVVGADTLRKRQPSNPDDPSMAVPDSCQVTLQLERSREGSVDAAFEEGGSFSATQTRTVQFTSAP